ncbi:MAG TPA: thioester reductase domain-containing protein, partial [Albitalea sp.]|nr:thioester reductase domain-containing protein [Albitalea sp.]
DRWLVDAVSLSPCGARRLRELAPRATVVRELRWPAHSLVHAASVVEDADARPAAGASPVDGALPGTALQMIDRHQHPAAVDARGRLAFGGCTVADRLLRQGLPDHGACLAAAVGAWLASDLPAWRAETACHAELPHAASALARRPHWLHAMERSLSTEAGVTEAAVVERLSQRGEWETAVFFAAAQGEAPGVLKARLAALCAADGAADAAVVEVVALPRGARAEIDRPALLRGEVPEIRRETGALDEAPRDEVEAALHAIWSGLLKRERIDIEEDFFDLGGQSLLASVMLYQVEEKLAVPLDMETLLASPTIAALARAVRAGGSAAGGVAPDLAARVVLPEDIVPAGTWQAGAPQEIFLTGATGFLGVHLLADLLQATPARVHCLVRAPDAAAGAQRLADALRSHGLWRAEHAARIVAVPGELDRPLLGLAEEAFAALAERIDAIYHNGAMVNFIYPYHSLERVNVLATQDVLRLACLHHAKPVHYVSTVGVLDRGAPAIPEVLDIALHDRLMGGYEQSKWVAEQLVCLAARRGLPVSIYRPSRIVGHSRTGRMNTDDLFCRLIKGIALFGKAPVDTGYDNMLPVDVASRAIVEASLNPEVHGHAVHVVNPQWNSMNALLDAIEARGHAIERLGYEPWLEQLARHVRQAPDHPLAMLIPVLRKLNPVADPTVGQRLPIAHDHLARWAPQALAQGLRPVEEWLAAYFAYFEASGYLPAPAASAVPVTRASPSVLVSEAEAEAG